MWCLPFNTGYYASFTCQNAKTAVPVCGKVAHLLIKMRKDRSMYQGHAHGFTFNKILTPSWNRPVTIFASYRIGLDFGKFGAKRRIFRNRGRSCARQKSCGRFHKGVRIFLAFLKTTVEGALAKSTPKLLENGTLRLTQEPPHDCSVP